MIRTILALALAAILAGCDTTSSSSVPSGAEAPRLTVTVLSGTKAAPVDSPTVRVDWSHENHVALEVRTARNSDDYPGDSFTYIPDTLGAGSMTFKFRCADSLRVFAWVGAKVDTGKIGTRDSSRIIYCK